MNITETRKKLEEALTKDIDFGNRNIFIFGAGATSNMYSLCFETEGIVPVCYVDNNPSKHGTVFNGRKVISADEIETASDGEPVILICSAQEDVREAIRKQLGGDRRYAGKVYGVDEYVFAKNKDKVLALFDMLEDELSKATYANMILSRMDEEPQDYGYYCGNQYFALPTFSKCDLKECFVDLGAYVGDTIEQYLNLKYGIFEKIYAFEPSHRNCEALRTRVKRLNAEYALDENMIEIIEAGIGENDGKMSVTLESSIAPSFGAMLGSSSGGAGSVDVYSIDSYFKDKRVTFIKADIESYEDKMITGAENVIKRDKPKMAVCVYHSASDMYVIAHHLKRLVPEYKFYLRQHICGSEETVLYAY